MKFRKKPVVIEAIRWNGNREAIAAFIPAEQFHFIGNGKRHELVIHALEGELKAQRGDWIIKGIKGEFYPCKPDIFKSTYETAE